MSRALGQVPPELQALGGYPGARLSASLSHRCVGRVLRGRSRAVPRAHVPGEGQK